MSTQNPVKTTWGDLLTAALRDSGALGIGMIPLSEDLLDASARGMWLLQGWERKRWLIWHLKTYVVAATGQSVDGAGTPFRTLSGRLRQSVPRHRFPSGLRGSLRGRIGSKVHSFGSSLRRQTARWTTRCDCFRRSKTTTQFE